MVIYSCHSRCKACYRSVTVQCIFDLSLSTANKTYPGNNSINVITTTKDGGTVYISDVEKFNVPVIEDGQILQIYAVITDKGERSTYFNLISHEEDKSRNVFGEIYSKNIILAECGSVLSYNLTLSYTYSSSMEIRRFSITPEGRYLCNFRQLLNNFCARRILQNSENVFTYLTTQVQSHEQNFGCYAIVIKHDCKKT